MNEQKKELMLKAAVQFKGVWPELDDPETAGEGEPLLLVAAIDDPIDGVKTGDFLANGFSGFSSIHYDSVCTRSEYEAFIDSLFECAPDDATHIGLASPDEPSWLKSDGNTWKWMSIGGWRVCGDGYSNGKYDVIPRPRKQEAEPEPIDAEFVEWSGAGLPPVGTVCEAVWLEQPDGGAREWTQCLVMGVYDDLVWINVHEYDNEGLYSGYPLTLPKHSIDFRPLKTESDKEREAMIEEAYDLWTDQFSVDGGAQGVKDYISDLIDAGWRPTEVTND